MCISFWPWPSQLEIPLQLLKIQFKFSAQIPANAWNRLPKSKKPVKPLIKCGTHSHTHTHTYIHTCRHRHVRVENLAKPKQKRQVFSFLARNAILSLWQNCCYYFARVAPCWGEWRGYQGVANLSFKWHSIIISGRPKNFCN